MVNLWILGGSRLEAAYPLISWLRGGGWRGAWLGTAYGGPKVQYFVSAPISFVSAPILLSRHPSSFLGLGAERRNWGWQENRDVSEVYWKNLKWYTDLVWKSGFILIPSKNGYKDDISKKHFQIFWSKIFWNQTKIWKLISLREWTGGDERTQWGEKNRYCTLGPP